MRYIREFSSEERDIKSIINRIKQEYNGTPNVLFDKIVENEDSIDIKFVMPNVESIKNNFCRRIYELSREVNCKITLTTDYQYSPFTKKITYGLRIPKSN